MANDGKKEKENNSIRKRYRMSPTNKLELTRNSSRSILHKNSNKSVTKETPEIIKTIATILALDEGK